MNTKVLIPTLIGLILSIGTVQAFAGSGWHYDLDSDTVIFSNDGRRAIHPATNSEHSAVQKSGSWYYDESSDSIVYNVSSSLPHYAQTKTSTEVTRFD